MKAGASIGETQQPFPGALDDDHRRQPPAAGRSDRANPASRSPPAGSGARFRRWHSLAIPAAGRPRHCQARDHVQPMKPGTSIGETRQPLPVAPDGDHRRQPPAGQKNFAEHLAPIQD